VVSTAEDHERSNGFKVMRKSEVTQLKKQETDKTKHVVRTVKSWIAASREQRQAITDYPRGLMRAQENMPLTW